MLARPDEGVQAYVASIETLSVLCGGIFKTHTRCVRRRIYLCFSKTERLVERSTEEGFECVKIDGQKLSICGQGVATYGVSLFGVYVLRFFHNQSVPIPKGSCAEL